MKCPECNEVLLNQNHCRDCGWRSDKQEASGRDCACGKPGSVLMNGKWTCSEHHSEMVDGPVLAKDIVSGYLQMMKARVTR